MEEGVQQRLNMVLFGKLRTSICPLSSVVDSQLILSLTSQNMRTFFVVFLNDPTIRSRTCEMCHVMCTVFLSLSYYLSQGSH